MSATLSDYSNDLWSLDAEAWSAELSRWFINDIQPRRAVQRPSQFAKAGWVLPSSNPHGGERGGAVFVNESIRRKPLHRSDSRERVSDRESRPCVDGSGG